MQISLLEEWQQPSNLQMAHVINKHNQIIISTLIQTLNLHSDPICFTFFSNLVQPRAPEASILQQRKALQPEGGGGLEKRGLKEGGSRRPAWEPSCWAQSCHRRQRPHALISGARKWVLLGADVGVKTTVGRWYLHPTLGLGSFPTWKKLAHRLDVASKLATSPFKAHH